MILFLPSTHIRISIIVVYAQILYQQKKTPIKLSNSNCTSQINNIHYDGENEMKSRYISEEMYTTVNLFKKDT